MRDIREIKRRKKKFNLKDVVINNIYNNLKEYLIVTILFLIGVIAGVIFVNNINESQILEVKEYINSFIEALKGDYHIDSISLLKNSLGDNLKLVIGMWFIGSTVIGIPIVLGIVLFRGFCIGYTGAVAIGVLGASKGIVFILVSIFLQSIIFIPTLLALAVSGIKLYKSIMKDKRRENIKLEIMRHTLCCFGLLLVLVIASIIEVYVSSNLLVACINFF